MTTSEPGIDLSVGRDSEANPAFRADTHGEGNGLRVEVVAPEKLVALVQSGREGVLCREVMFTGAGPRAQQQSYCKCRQKNKCRLHYCLITFVNLLKN